MSAVGKTVNQEDSWGSIFLELGLSASTAAVSWGLFSSTDGDETVEKVSKFGTIAIAAATGFHALTRVCSQTKKDWKKLTKWMRSDNVNARRIQRGVGLSLFGLAGFVNNSYLGAMIGALGVVIGNADLLLSDDASRSRSKDSRRKEPPPSDNPQPKSRSSSRRYKSEEDSSDDASRSRSKDSRRKEPPPSDNQQSKSRSSSKRYKSEEDSSSYDSSPESSPRSRQAFHRQADFQERGRSSQNNPNRVPPRANSKHPIYRNNSMRNSHVAANSNMGRLPDCLRDKLEKTAVYRVPNRIAGQPNYEYTIASISDAMTHVATHYEGAKRSEEFQNVVRYLLTQNLNLKNQILNVNNLRTIRTNDYPNLGVLLDELVRPAASRQANRPQLPPFYTGPLQNLNSRNAASKSGWSGSNWESD